MSKCPHCGELLPRAAVVTAREAAEFLCMSEWWLKKARREGHGPAFVRTGRTIRYRVADLDRWLAEHTRGGPRKETRT